MILLDMHNDPEFALNFLEKNPKEQIATTSESLDGFLLKISENQKERWEKQKSRVQILPPIFK